MRIKKMLPFTVSILTCTVLGLLRYMTGPDVAFSIFFLFPIMFTIWFSGYWMGVIVSFISITYWLIADIIFLDHFPNMLVPILNEILRLIVYLIFIFILHRIKTLMQNNVNLVRIDDLTGLYNRRTFFTFAEMELNRAQRSPRPLTIVFIDLDNFKAVNDNFGHEEGDRILSLVGSVLKENTRNIDIASRFGGDEFVILLSGESWEDVEATAQSTLSKLRKNLLTAVREWGKPITFSIGAVTFHNPPIDLQELISMADSAMYQGKKNGRDQIIHWVY
jgi:diguanylate cyclase (GGDEF)-like protein